MSALEEAGLLDRQVEVLPSDAGLADLRAGAQGLTRPELAVVLAYAKIALFDKPPEQLDVTVTWSDRRQTSFIAANWLTPASE